MELWALIHRVVFGGEFLVAFTGGLVAFCAASFAGVANCWPHGRVQPGEVVLDLGCGAGMTEDRCEEDCCA